MPMTALALNPWRSAWTRPRETIQAIVDGNPEYQVYTLAALTGVCQTLERASTRHMGDEMSLAAVLGIVALAGPISGVIAWYISSALIGWTGKWVGGVASYQQVRAAVAWSALPLIASLLLLAPELWFYGKELFTSHTPEIDDSPYLYLLFIALEFGLAMWTLVLFLKMLGQVQGFSAWRALGNVLLAALVIVLPIVVIAFGVSLFK